ncbi:MAG: hypothetical protein JXA73_17465 [Acidobacteria bacterium]|nr:hypothetical protein [Acidobacteriota bacterium]
MKLSGSKNGQPGRCVHCLRSSEVLEADHVFPNSWYPDSTPATIQRWTVPSCPECNRKLGQLEKDLLIRLMLCVDPKLEAASGLHTKVFRSLGIDADDLPKREQAIRAKLRERVKSEMIPKDTVSELPGKIPGLGPSDAESPWSLPIPWAGLSIIIEKIVRGCEYRLRQRYIELPYGIRTFVDQPYDVLREPYESATTTIDFGPGCRIKRVFAREDPDVVLYWIIIWGTLYSHARIDLESELIVAEKLFGRSEGISPSDLQGGMSISEYLRSFNQDDMNKR